MDIVGALGYCGQELVFLDNGLFAYHTGNSVCIVDIVVGPRELMWRQENGIRKIASHVATQKLAIAPITPGASIELISVSDSQEVSKLRNPTLASIIEITFSRNGERLCGLTDVLDRKIISWDISSGNILFVVDLARNLSRCSFNPASSEELLFWGKCGVEKGQISEIMGTHFLKLTSFQPDSSRSPVTGSDDSNFFQEANDKVQFICWVPVNKAFIATFSGNLYLLNLTTSKFSYVTKLIDQDPQVTDLIHPTCGMLSLDHLIIGTSAGRVLWFSLSSLEPSDVRTSAIAPLQICNMSAYVSSLSADPNFDRLFAGSGLGSIFKLPVEVKEKVKIPAEGEEDVVLDDVAGVEADTGPMVISGDRLCHFQDGAVLCNVALFVPIVGTSTTKISKKSTNLLSLFVTGSHYGKLTFWKQPAIESEPMTSVAGGIRRSMPRPLKILSTIEVADGTTATSLCVLPSNIRDGSCLLGIGTGNGWLEIYKIDAMETDDEEDEESQGGLEDFSIVDEDGVRVYVRPISRHRVFEKTLSLMCRASDWDSRESPHLVAVASYFESTVFILRGDENDSFDLVMELSIELGANPTAMSWVSSGLCVCTESGKTYFYSEESLFNGTAEVDHHNVTHDAPSFSWSCEVGPLVNGLFVPSAGHLLAVSLNSTRIICYEQSFPEEAEDGAPAPAPASEVDGESQEVVSEAALHSGFLPERFITFGENEHSGVVISCALSPNEKFLATGCADGTVFIWAVVGEWDPEIGRQDDAPPTYFSYRLFTSVCFHSESVISLTFSMDSSLLYTCGADGSFFVCTVDKPAYVEYEFESARHSVRVRRSQHATANALVGTTVDNSRVPWIQEKRAYLRERQKHDGAEVASELRASVAELSSRLQHLLLKNDTRTELEKMDRSEFVIDIKRKNAIIEENARSVAGTREKYRLRKFFNELNAARIRTAFWDVLESKSVAIVPFSAGVNSKDVRTVTSFSVPQQTEHDLQILTKVRRLRSIEIRSQRVHGFGVTQRLPGGKMRVGWNSSTQGLPSSISWICGDGYRWPNHEFCNLLLQRDNEKVVDVKSDKKDAADEEDDQSMNSQENQIFEVDDEDLFNLLYFPESIRTEVQKRTQIILLKEVIRMSKLKFNEIFDKVSREKEEAIAAVESRQTRILSILEELNQREVTEKLRRLDIEVPGSAVVVGESEILSKPYETEAMREQRLREEEEARNRAGRDEAHEALMRALDDMMHGTLEVKRNVFAEASALTRPEWMATTAVADMTESQLREYEQFEQKYKELQEEQAAYRKVLEQELKKLKVEIVDTTKSFDEKLVALSKVKLHTQREILTYELFMSRLACNIVKREQCASNLRQLEAASEKHKHDLLELHTRVEKFTVYCEEIKSKMNAIQEDERSLDKGFKRDIQLLCGTTFDQDTLKTLTMLYRIRSYPRDDDDADDLGDAEGNGHETTGQGGKGWSKGSKDASKNSKTHQSKASRGSKNNNTSGTKTLNKQHRRSQAGLYGSKANSRARVSKSTGGNGLMLGPMQEAAQALKNPEAPQLADKDPFFAPLLRLEKKKKQFESQIPMLIPLNMDVDLPEGFNMDQFTWSKLQELRTARLEKEIAAKHIAMEYHEAKAKLEVLQAEEAALWNTVNSLQAQRKENTESFKLMDNDLEVIVNLRQGQDEIDRDAIVTDYSDALLLPTSVISKFNSRIKELGKDKIGVLSKIKTFRRKINLVDWEAQHLSLESKHYEEYYTDLQLFRVTRELQHLLREGSDADQTKDRLDKVAQRKDFMQKDAESKFMKMKRTKESLRKQLTERTEELTVLDRRIRELRGQVLARKSVRQSRDDARGGSANGNSAESAMKTMRRIVARRQLVDTARAQAEEIDFLRQELDKIRQRTFPAFVRAVKTRIPNPDER